MLILLDPPSNYILSNEQYTNRRWAITIANANTSFDRHQTIYFEQWIISKRKMNQRWTEFWLTLLSSILLVDFCWRLIRHNILQFLQCLYWHHSDYQQIISTHNSSLKFAIDGITVLALVGATSIAICELMFFVRVGSKDTKNLMVSLSSRCSRIISHV